MAVHWLKRTNKILGPVKKSARDSVLNDLEFWQPIIFGIVTIPFAEYAKMTPVEVAKVREAVRLSEIVKAEQRDDLVETINKIVNGK